MDESGFGTSCRSAGPGARLLAVRAIAVQRDLVVLGPEAQALGEPADRLLQRRVVERNQLPAPVGIAVAAAGVMELIGIQRARGRDLATGIVLGAGFGLAALFLYLGTTVTSTTGATVTILFGSIFALDPSVLPLARALGAVALGIVSVLYRPLLISSLSPELAAARGIPVRLVGALYLAAMALAVALSAVTIGAILSTALLVGPAAAALQLTLRPGRAIAAAVLIGVAAMWCGLLLAYDSYYWPPLHRGWPVSFFVVTLVLLAYLGARAVGRRHH